MYRGYWRENHLHGKGMLKSDAGMYSGDFIMHKICGFGRYDFSNGSVYIGDFKDNCFHGKGILGYDDEQVYEGDFFEGLRHGKGTMVFGNGDTYEGGWFEGRRTGTPQEDGTAAATEGIYVAHDGKEVYQGGFLDNKRHGPGSLWLASHGASGAPGEFSRQAVQYDMGKLLKHRQRPSCRPVLPSLKPFAALAKARSQNANWGASADDEFSRPFTNETIMSKKAKGQSSLLAVTEDDDDDDDDDDFGEEGKEEGRAAEEDDDQNENADGFSRVESAASGEYDDEDDGEKPKSTFIQKVFGKCMPWLVQSEETDADGQGAQGFEGKPNSIVIVKIEKCVHLPAMVNNETSNAFVEVRSRGKHQKTQVIKDTLDPLYEEKFDMEHNTEDEVRDLTLTVYHAKLGKGKQFLGKLHVDLARAKVGDNVKMKMWELTYKDGVTPVTCKDPGSGKTVTSGIFMSWNLSLKPEALVSMRLSNAKNINSPDTRGLGFPFVKVKFDDRVIKSAPAKVLEMPRWDQSISFDTLSIEQLYILPASAKPSPKMIIEVWDSKAIGDDIFIGSCETDISKIRYETRSDMEWHRLSDKTRPRRANVGDIKFSIAWGPNEPTNLCVQIEEGYALTKHLQSSILQGGKKRGFFSKKDDSAKEEVLPSAFLKFALDNTRKRKTNIVKNSCAPQWQEKHLFKVLQSELPTQMLVQCYHSHLLGEEFIGMVAVDLTGLELNRMSFVRWYRLQDIELKALADKKKRAAEKAKQKEKAILEGTYVAEDDGEDEDLELEEEEAELTSYLHQEKAGFLSRMTGAGTAKARRMQLLRQLNSGKNPDELGRVRIRLTWTSIDDEEEIQAQKIWQEQMKNPRKRKIMKKVMKNWISEYQRRAFDCLLRQAALQRRMEDQALHRYKESKLPRFFSLWQGHMHMLRLQETCLYHYNLRCRQKPVFEAWVFEVDKSHKRERIKRGEYPGNPDDLPIQAPLEMFNIAGSDYQNPDLIQKDKELILAEKRKTEQQGRTQRRQKTANLTMAGAQRQEETLKRSKSFAT